MTGVTFPASISSLRTSRSSWFSLAMNVFSVWPMNRDSTSARTWRSLPPSQRPLVSPPAMTSVPVRRERPPQAASDAFPPMSRMTS